MSTFYKIFSQNIFTPIVYEYSLLNDYIPRDSSPLERNAFERNSFERTHLSEVVDERQLLLANPQNSEGQYGLELPLNVIKINNRGVLTKQSQYYSHIYTLRKQVNSSIKHYIFLHMASRYTTSKNHPALSFEGYSYRFDRLNASNTKKI